MQRVQRVRGARRATGRHVPAQARVLSGRDPAADPNEEGAAPLGRERTARRAGASSRPEAGRRNRWGERLRVSRPRPPTASTRASSAERGSASTSRRGSRIARSGGISMRCAEASSSRAVATIGTSSGRRSRLRRSAGAVERRARALELPSSRRFRRPSREASRVDVVTRPSGPRDASRLAGIPLDVGTRRRCSWDASGLEVAGIGAQGRLELEHHPIDAGDRLLERVVCSSRKSRRARGRVPEGLATLPGHRGRFFGRSSRGRKTIRPSAPQ